MPDGAVRGFHLGLTVLLPIEAVGENTNARPPLPGLLTQHRYKILLNEEEGDYTVAMPKVQAHFLADPLWKVRSPYEAAGALARFYDLFMRFLLIVGLSSLLVGGVGISNAVSAYIGERQRSIATLRSLGATGPRILVHFFTQIGILSLIGIVHRARDRRGADGDRAADARAHPQRQPAAHGRLAVAGHGAGVRHPRGVRVLVPAAGAGARS